MGICVLDILKYWNVPFKDENFLGANPISMRRKKPNHRLTPISSISVIPGIKATKSQPQNRLFYGDNLDILRKYVKDESVDLCYIDPPFNSKRNYNQIYNNIGKEDQAQSQAFVDTWTWDDAAVNGFSEIIENERIAFSRQTIEMILGLEKVLGKGSLLSYLVHMSLRISEIYRVLKPTGSFYLHCDQTASHYLKIIIDSIFCSGKGEFQNEIIWQRTRSAKQQSNAFGRITDVILFYSKTENCLYNKQYTPLRDEYIKSHYNNIEEKTGRKYMLDNFSQAGQGEPRQFGKKVLSPPNGKHWIWTQERINIGMTEGRIVFTDKGTPRVKRYLDEAKGEYMSNIWTDIPEINSQAKERLGYPTQKPEALLERIIKASSNEGDVVLDAYCGCGTTVAVSERLNRKWIGMDITYQSISLILKRLEEHFGLPTIQNISLSGVPEDFKSAQALANKEDDRTRKEFEKWVVLTYSNNRAAINERKGGDNGIDGIAYLLDLNNKKEKDFKQIIFSVKSNKTLSPSVIRDLNGTIERENAAMGILLTLYPMDNLVKESKKYGTYNNVAFGQNYPKIQVISIEEILQGKTMKIPTSLEVLKQAEKKSNVKQGKLYE